MRFSGIQKISLLDFPDRIGTLLFTPGCNLRCPFCHNWRIVLDPRGPFLTEDDALQILENRKKFVDSVVITGGEPTLQQDLPEFLEKIKKLNFSVKLDTNGFFPDVLKRCFHYLDYVAIDVKTCPERYHLMGGIEIDGWLETIRMMIKQNHVDYEFRNTVVPKIVDKECIPQMGELVNGGKCFVFQQFVPGDTLSKAFNTVKPYPPETITHFADIMKSYVREVKLRI
jgi:pyruvate formate lyase activating enzyme